MEPDYTKETLTGEHLFLIDVIARAVLSRSNPLAKVEIASSSLHSSSQ
jgi:hypothetical protein